MRDIAPSPARVRSLSPRSLAVGGVKNEPLGGLRLRQFQTAFADDGHGGDNAMRIPQLLAALSRD